MTHQPFSTSLKITLLATALTCGAGLRADTMMVIRPHRSPGINHGEFHSAPFRESGQARMLRDAYIILATGNHNYNGHRVGAMQMVRAAADSLGLDLRGDGNNLQPQPLSNEKLREAKDLILHVRESAWVKRQGKIFIQLSEAVHQINEALGIK